MALLIEIKVSPSSGRLECKLDKNGNLKCWLKSPAEQGKANAELIKFFAKTLGVSQDKVVLVSGQTSRSKRLKIDTPMTFEQLLEIFGIHRQTTMFDV
jgi:uncharacterized protein (TIGR00251 family)